MELAPHHRVAPSRHGLVPCAELGGLLVRPSMSSSVGMSLRMLSGGGGHSSLLAQYQNTALTIWSSLMPLCSSSTILICLFTPP
ncbi:hypothetical protein, partial [uncultured Ellagibacter sp.]|uniref:hypothetical protein n=1 Tax=uncultured Ellagibacter sp. TaxID=2137580 RepID=UPI00263510BD